MKKGNESLKFTKRKLYADKKKTEDPKYYFLPYKKEREKKIDLLLRTLYPTLKADGNKKKNDERVCLKCLNGEKKNKSVENSISPSSISCRSNCI